MSFHAAANPAVSSHLPSPDRPEEAQNRRKHPCVLCQQRKVKCDRTDPCANCVKARVECVSPTTLPPRRRKKRFPEAELLARLRKYEQHLRSYGADIDAINAEGPNTSPPSNSTSTPTIKVSPSPQVDSTTPVPVRSLSIRRSLKNIENTLSRGVNPEFQDAEELLQGSSEDEMFENPISRTYDNINEYGSDLVFPSPTADDLRDLHPSTVHIFRLWQRFLESVNPLIRIFHAPTVQQQVLDATADLDNVPKGVEALMFGIYSMAITSFPEWECLPIFGESKETLLKRYHSGARLALQRAGLLRSSDLTILQAYVLYLMSCLNFTMDPRTLFCLTGIAIRIAQRMGLTFDGTSFGLPPFQVEMRRRLWWQLLLLDTRVSELSGAGSSIVNHTWTTKLPSNVNDSDLFPDMKEPPQEHPGATEMVFVLHRCEVANLAQQLQDQQLPLSVKDELASELENRLEKSYIQYCDPSIPFHLMTMLMAKLGTGKIRMLPWHPHLMSNISEAEIKKREFLFRLSLSCLETHNKMMISPGLERFMWFVLTNFPMPQSVFLLCSLRYQTTGELADRAWELFEERFLNQNMKLKDSEFWRKNKDSLIHLAIANLTVKAWEAREKAFVAMQQPLPLTPNFIEQMRQQLALKGKSTRSSTAGTETTPPSATTTTGIGAGTGPGMGIGIGEQFTESFQWFNPAAGDPNQAFDLMPGMMTNDPQQMGWEFWNDLMQPNMGGYVQDGVGFPAQQTYL